MKNIETTNYVNHIFLNRSSYKTFRDNYEFNDPNKVRWNGIPIPFLDIILDCGVDIVDIIINKGIELDSGEFIDCDTSDLEDVYNAINKFKESKKENQQDGVYFIKYTSSNLKSNIVYGGIYVYRNGVYINIFSDLIFDHDEYKIIESIKLDDFIGTLIKYMVKYFSNDVSIPTYQYYIPEEKRNNEYDGISDKLKRVKDFNCTYFEKEDKDPRVEREENTQITGNDDITAPITPEEVKDIGDIYDINQVIKHMSMIKDDYFRKQLYFRLAEDAKDTFEWPTDGFRSFDDDTNKYMKGYASSFDPNKFGRKSNSIPYKLYFPIVDEHYIDLNNDDVEYGMSSNHKDWKYMIGVCRELKTYIITATGGEETRAYAFVDKKYHILQKAELNEICDMKEVIAPKGSAYLIVNSKNGPLNIVKK